jgi:hypothetical protein
MFMKKLFLLLSVLSGGTQVYAATMTIKNAASDRVEVTFITGCGVSMFEIASGGVYKFQLADGGLQEESPELVAEVCGSYSIEVFFPKTRKRIKTKSNIKTHQQATISEDGKKIKLTPIK